MNEPVLITPEGRLHEESGPIGKRIRAPVLPAAEPTVRQGVLEIPGELALHHGGRLTGVRLGWRLVGPVNAPVDLRAGWDFRRPVCMSRVTVSTAVGGRNSLGPARPLDTHRYRVLSFDYLGGSGET